MVKMMMNTKVVEMKEWDFTILEGYELPDNNARQMAKLLTNNGIIEILELKNDIHIKSNYYVGRIKIGDLQINIRPKLEGLPLYHLMKYTYGLRDLAFLSRAEYNIDKFSFFDLLIFELYIEANDLFLRGINRDYILKEDSLQSPRGRIDIDKLCSQGGVIEAKLPCRYFDRDENNILNQILLAGLKLSLDLVVDRELKIYVNRLCKIFSESIDDIILTRDSLQYARNSMNRLTERYAGALEIINILYESQGIKLKDNSTKVNLQGYYFDMNAFFERLVHKLLMDYFKEKEYVVKSQHSMYNMFAYAPGFNPLHRKPPTPRPDFAIMKDGKVVKLLDAKYRDLWEKSLPTHMLYQLAIYAVSGMGDNTSTILYPSMDDTAVVQKIDIKDPIKDTKIAEVILQPINLNKVAMAIGEGKNIWH